MSGSVTNSDLLVDVKQEVVLAYNITDSKVGDNEQVPALVEQACANLPAKRIQTLAYDKAADDEKVHECLYDHGIKPIIQNRALWKTEPNKYYPGGRYPLNLIHDEAGTVSCYDTVSRPTIRHRMSYIGYDGGTGNGALSVPGTPRGLVLSQRGQVQYGQGLWTDGSSAVYGGVLDHFPPVPRRRWSSSSCTGAGRHGSW